MVVLFYEFLVILHEKIVSHVLEKLFKLFLPNFHLFWYSNYSKKSRLGYSQETGNPPVTQLINSIEIREIKLTTVIIQIQLYLG
jgi:hypothetical protein